MAHRLLWEAGMRITAALVTIALLAGVARAQEPSGCADCTDEPAPPPPVYAPPPPIYPPPPPTYYYPQQPLMIAPPRFHYEEKRNWGLATAGLLVFGVSWTVNASVAYVAQEGYLAIPVAGPIIEAAKVGGGSCGFDCGLNRMAVAGLVFDGLVEAAGAAMAIAGMATKHKVKVFDKIAIAPVANGQTFGVAAAGRF
jgi:hypothetical protein